MLLNLDGDAARASRSPDQTYMATFGYTRREAESRNDVLVRAFGVTVSPDARR
jgi:hypothetical protein